LIERFECKEDEGKLKERKEKKKEAKDPARDNSAGGMLR